MSTVLTTQTWSTSWRGRAFRESEVCGLQWDDLALGDHYLTVNRAVAYRQHRLIIGAPKSGKARRVDVPEPLVARLRARQSLREAETAVAGRELSPWVFPAPSDDTKPMNAAFLRTKVWYRLLRRADVRPIRLHDLRHTYASLLLLAGEPMIYVKEQLGHSTIQVTVDLYGHIRPGVNRGAVNRLAEATRPGAPIVQLHSNYTQTAR
jgi:integrase